MRNAVCTLVFLVLIVASFYALDGFVNNTEALKYIRPSIFTMNLLAELVGFFIACGIGFASTIVMEKYPAWKAKKKRAAKSKPKSNVIELGKAK